MWTVGWVGGFRISDIISRCFKIVACREALLKYLHKSVRIFLKRNMLSRFLTIFIQSNAIDRMQHIVRTS